MRTTVGGTTITISGQAWFLRFAGTPIYHAWGRRDLSRCGLVLFEDGREKATPLPPRLACRVGRPCVRCWPELQRQTALFRGQRVTKADLAEAIQRKLEVDA